MNLNKIEITEEPFSVTQINKADFKKILKDKITGLPNKDALMLELYKFKESHIIILGIDDYDILLNLHGANTCNDLLKILVNKLKLNPLYNKIYKVEHDNFVIVLQSKNLKKCLSSLVLYIDKKTFKVNKERIRVHVSLGCSVSNRKVSDRLNDCRAALCYSRSKSISFACYTKRMSNCNFDQKNTDIANLMIEDKELSCIVPYYQPIVDIQTSKIYKHECLARLIMDGKVYPPVSFLGIAKSLKIYHKVTKVILQKSFEKFNGISINFSVNLSAIDIEDRETRTFILKLVEKNPETAKFFTIEILESAEIENETRMVSFMEKMKSKGVKIALDDFGTGYSNLGRLGLLNVDFIKIDGSLIKNLESCEHSRVLVKTVTNYAKDTNVKVVAEFIENERIELITKKLGVEYGQGYFYSPATKEPLTSIFVARKNNQEN